MPKISAEPNIPDKIANSLVHCFRLGMDHQQEQEQEVEALTYIFAPDELEIQKSHPCLVKLSSQITDQELLFRISAKDPQTDIECVSYTIEFQFPETYPETVPEMVFGDFVGVELCDQEMLIAECTSHAQELIGMAMVYSISSFAQERLVTIMMDRFDREDHDAEQAAIKQEEEEAARYRGTLVTVESFLEWQQNFLAESQQVAKSGGVQTRAMQAAIAIDRMGKPPVSGGKLTGRQLFEKDKNLFSQDSQFLDDNDVTVDVDMFEGMRDLNVEDEVNEVLAGLVED